MYIMMGIGFQPKMTVFDALADPVQLHGWFFPSAGENLLLLDSQSDILLYNNAMWFMPIADMIMITGLKADDECNDVMRMYWTH